MSKILTVFGASGVQGGSVIQAVLNDRVLSKEFKIRAVTRDVSKPSLQKFQDHGIEVVSADMKSPSSLAKVLEGSHTVFLVTLPDFMTSPDAGTELDNGKNVADAAKAIKLEHLIFSSLINVTEASKGRLPHVMHFDRKADIEQYIRSLHIPATFIQPGYYMTNFVNLQLLRKGEDESYTLTGPTSATKAQLPLFDPVNDMGKYVVAAMRKRNSLLGKTIPAASDYYTLSRVMEEFQSATGKSGTYNQIPQDVYKSFLPPPIAQEILENELLCEEPGFFAGASLVDGHKLLAEVGLAPTSWKDYLQSEKSTFE